MVTRKRHSMDTSPYLTEFVDCTNLSEASDDDVIFVKEYRRGEMNKKTHHHDKANGKKNANAKNQPRRNPVRRARQTRRFQDFTDGSIDESDNNCLDETEEDEEEQAKNQQDGSSEASSVAPPKTAAEDAEEWNVHTVLRRRQKRKRMPYRYIRMGRRKAICTAKNKNESQENKKVTLKDMETLLKDNLILARNFVNNVKFLSCQKNLDTNYNSPSSDRVLHAKQLLRQQLVLFAISKDIQDSDVLKCFKD